MRIISVACLGLLLATVHGLCLADVPLNGLTEAEKRGGWNLLFDGKSTNGWRNYRKDGINAGWAVKDGALTRADNGAGSIITTEQFDNFELSLQYKIEPGGDSGIMFRVSEDAPQPGHTGPEIQILDNEAGKDEQQAGWLYQLYHPVKPDWARGVEQLVGITTPEVDDATRPAGQWNHIYLRLTSGQCEVALNGVSYYYFRVGDDDWNQQVAASKFAKMPKFGKNDKGHICLQDHGHLVAFRNIKIRKIPPDLTVPEPVDGQLPLKGVVSFPHLKWQEWEGYDDNGRIRPLRPLILTHAGDGTNRIFVATQSGMLHVFPNDQEAKLARMFLDLRPRVSDWARDTNINEEGLLGLAFHPQYKENGQFFVYYSSREESQTSIVSRFHVSANDPDRADPDSELVLMKIPQTFPNHNGGAIAFGPDGFLYISLGDGGGRNDPLSHGQNLKTWMGSILRIDVDKQQDDLNYAIPADNPFVDRQGARPEIYAYGFRNVWRMAFDRDTGALWVSDVGQDLWEEINIVQRGGNYGWSLREGSYGFSGQPQQFQDPPIDPVWEYDHQVGKSITGGYIYRGSRFPELVGSYLYADFVTGKIWAIRYDVESGRVIKNMSIATTGIPVHSFGEDELGEVYYMLETVNGRGIYRFERLE